jgi:tetratricopeptide (TPR) repeat protein
MRLGVALAVISWVWIGVAQAQEKSGKQKRADELFEQGRKELAGAGTDKDKIKSACDTFDEAIKLDPEAPGTMLNLGLCNEKLEKYKTALYWFRKAQARAAETNLPDYENAAKQHTVDLAGKVATIKIMFASPPPGDTRVKIDNDEVAPADYLHAEVDAGHHTLVAGAAGKKIFTQEFDVEGRGGQTINVELVEGSNTIVVDRGAKRRKIAIYTAIGGGVLLASSGLLSVYDRHQYDKCVNDSKMLDMTKLMDGTCPETDPGKATDYANHYQKQARYVGTTLFVLGGATVGVAAFFYFTAPEKERIDRTVFAPAIGPDQIGFTASGSF